MIPQAIAQLSRTGPNLQFHLSNIVEVENNIWVGPISPAPSLLLALPLFSFFAFFCVGVLGQVGTPVKPDMEIATTTNTANSR